MINKLVHKLIKWSQEKRTERFKVLILIGDAILFWLVIPAFLSIIAIGLDKWLNFPKLLASELLGVVLALVFFVSGILLGFWATFIQYKIGEGTPAPDAPTQRLVTAGPYGYIRNPIVLGQIIAYVGFGFYFNSLSFIVIVMPLVVSIHICYLKLVEEKELEIRFGEEYKRYKQKVSMFVPKLKRKM